MGSSGSSAVYQNLKELFPQVDARILKAVAIDSKDTDRAVELILSEVLPFIVSWNAAFDVKNNGKVVEESSPSSSVPVSTGEDVSTSLLNDGHNIDSACLNETLDDHLDFYDAKDSDDQLNRNTKNEEFNPLKWSEETRIESDCEKKEARADRDFDKQSSSSNVEVGEGDVSLSNCQNVQPFEDCNSMEHGIFTDHHESGIPLTDVENPEMSSFIDADFVQESTITDKVGTEDETQLTTVVTRSGQICRINLLEDIIEDVKNHKDTLFLQMESVIELTKEVELQENAAQQAKEAASRGGFDILEKVEEIKKMLTHAKEANDMHSGEVYGEKSILATEVRELQTRLLGLSEEKDKSLSILDEMRKTLEARLVLAEEERRAAEQEMLEKEGVARGALAEQELIMEEVVQESKLLQQEAEENAKLRDFLMEKGHLVDILQGEIAVICQDVKSLKENFEHHVSVTKSLSFNFKKTSSLLASSNSSVKSMASNSALEQTESPKSPRNSSRAPSFECQTPGSSVSVRSPTRKEILDDDWELFDF